DTRASQAVRCSCAPVASSGGEGVSAGGAGGGAGGCSTPEDHSSVPVLPSLAAKNRMPLMLTRDEGLELGEPGLMSLTGTVREATPWLCESPLLALPSSAPKKRVPPTLVRLAG